jgi:hypothetical protein
VIFGLEPSAELPPNWTPLDAVAVVKCLDEDGSLSFVIRSTKTLSDWECFGLLELAARSQANTIVHNIEDDDEGEEDS